MYTINAVKLAYALSQQSKYLLAKSSGLALKGLQRDRVTLNLKYYGMDDTMKISKAVSHLSTPAIQDARVWKPFECSFNLDLERF